MIQPTNGQVAALKKFKIPQKEIDLMSFDQASERLEKLIAEARARDATKNNTSPKPKSVMTTLAAKNEESDAGSMTQQMQPASLSDSFKPALDITATLRKAQEYVRDSLHVPTDTEDFLLYTNMIYEGYLEQNRQLFQFRMQQQEQQFDLAMNKLIQSQKLANIEEVKKSR